MKISELASKAGVNVSTVRYYEQIGLLPVPPRAPNGYRIYACGDLALIRFITRSRALDLGLDAIRDIIAYRERDVSPCGYVRAQIDAKIVEIDQRIEALNHLRGELRSLQRKHAGQSHLDGDDGSICRVLDDDLGAAADGDNGPCKMG